MSSPDTTPDEHTMLNKVHAGGLMLATLARGRIDEALDALNHGDFDRASDILQEALGKLQPLVAAQNHMAMLHGCMIVRAADVVTGMSLQGWGEVVHREIESRECGHRVVSFRFESGREVDFDARQELIADPR